MINKILVRDQDNNLKVRILVKQGRVFTPQILITIKIIFFKPYVKWIRYGKNCNSLFGAIRDLKKIVGNVPISVISIVKN